MAEEIRAMAGPRVKTQEPPGREQSDSRPVGPRVSEIAESAWARGTIPRALEPGRRLLGIYYGMQAPRPGDWITWPPPY
jgi:hypothetical protein